MNPKRQHVRAHVIHLDLLGNVVHEEYIAENIWHDEGEQQILNRVFARTAANWNDETEIFIGIDARAAIAESDDLSDLLSEPEVGSKGYERQITVTSGDGSAGQDWVVSQPGAYYRAYSKEVTFSCSETAWPTMENCFLTCAGSAVAPGDGDRLFCSLALTSPRTLADGESLKVTMDIGISE